MRRFAFALLIAAAAVPAVAQETEPERCPRFVADHRIPVPSGSLVVPANVVLAQATSDLVQLTFIGHATFLIESPAGVTIATDYNGTVKPAVVPRIVTMNRAHTTHYTLAPEPEIEYVFQGWGEDGEPARHELAVEDVWLRNVTTNIRGGFGMSGAIQRDMNSMFVFEVAGLCIAHLGHLHHELTEDHLKALGRVDVVLAPVDGTYTLNIDDMIGVLDDIGAGDPDALLQQFDAGAVSRPARRDLRDRIQRRAARRPVARHAAGAAHRPRPARVLAGVTAFTDGSAWTGHRPLRNLLSHRSPIMSRITTAAAATLLAAAGLTASVVTAAAEFFGWQVANVANWDVLNVRAWPASYSQILVAYPNGTPLSLTGKCTKDLNLNQIAGWPAAQQAAAVRYRWCEVWVDPLGNGNFRTGWVYGRYIKPL